MAAVASWSSSDGILPVALTPVLDGGWSATAVARRRRMKSLTLAVRSCPPSALYSKSHRLLGLRSRRRRRALLSSVAAEEGPDGDRCQA